MNKGSLYNRVQLPCGWFLHANPGKRVATKPRMGRAEMLHKFLQAQSLSVLSECFGGGLSLQEKSIPLPVIVVHDG